MTPSMRWARLGLAISHDYVRLVMVRGREIEWVLESERAVGEDPESDVRSLLDSAPIRRWPRPSVVVAVGPSLAQTKRLEGLPPVTDPNTLAKLVQESAGRFFLKNGVPLVTTGVRVAGAGIAWASAFEQPLIAGINGACRDSGLRVRAIVPAVAVVGLALDTDRIAWRDGPITAEIHRVAGELTQVQRVGSTLSAGTSGSGVTPSVSEGSVLDPARFADAYGAALLPASEAMSVRGRSSSERHTATPRWRLIAAELSLVLAITAALLVPGFLAHRSIRQARTRLVVIAPAATKAIAAARELRLTTSALSELARFDASRRSSVLTLAAISHVLPEGAAIVALRMDSTSGTLAALAPKGAALLERLERAQGIAAPEIVGPVTRELVGTTELDRVSIRFLLGTRPVLATRVPR